MELIEEIRDQIRTEINLDKQEEWSPKQDPESGDGWCCLQLAASHQ